MFACIFAHSDRSKLVDLLNGHCATGTKSARSLELALNSDLNGGSATGSRNEQCCGGNHIVKLTDTSGLVYRIKHHIGNPISSARLSNVGNLIF